MRMEYYPIQLSISSFRSIISTMSLRGLKDVGSVIMTTVSPSSMMSTFVPKTNPRTKHQESYLTLPQSEVETKLVLRCSSKTAYSSTDISEAYKTDI